MRAARRRAMQITDLVRVAVAHDRVRPAARAPPRVRRRSARRCRPPGKSASRGSPGQNAESWRALTSRHRSHAVRANACGKTTGLSTLVDLRPVLQCLRRPHASCIEFAPAATTPAHATATATRPPRSRRWWEQRPATRERRGRRRRTTRGRCTSRARTSAARVRSARSRARTGGRTLLHSRASCRRSSRRRRRRARSCRTALVAAAAGVLRASSARCGNCAQRRCSSRADRRCSRPLHGATCCAARAMPPPARSPPRCARRTAMLDGGARNAASSAPTTSRRRREGRRLLLPLAASPSCPAARWVYAMRVGDLRDAEDARAVLRAPLLGPRAHVASRAPAAASRAPPF